MKLSTAPLVRCLAATAVSAVLLAGCASGSGDNVTTSEPPPTSGAPAQASTTAPAETSSAEPTPSETTEDPGSGGSGSDSWTMPDETGTDLQDAQNDIQHLTSYGIAITRSHDASGDGRHQILDHDWKVCSQNIDAGETITSDSDIVFEVVKQDETCP